MPDSCPPSFATGYSGRDPGRAQPDLSHNSLRAGSATGQHLIICIGRTYGSAGTDVGFNLADTLKINYYDTEIFAEVLERLEAEQDEVRDRASFAHHQNLNQCPWD